MVVLAPLGADLPAKGVKIERRTIAGVTSEGMLCSEAELGLTDDAAGILVLPEKFAVPGTSFAKAVPEASDTIFELDLTPNRPDALGHLGLAREVGALLSLRWQDAQFDDPWAAHAKGDTPVQIRVEDVERCQHYGAGAVQDVTIGPSPLGVRYRLAALGVRPISNLVDITNLVMLEAGHPMHAFDLERVRGGKIVVRRAKDGEKLETLDGVARTLVADDLVICDGEGPVALAGIMGGASSEIRATTKRVLFECAYFDPRGVRRSARRHAMHTESSHRFERGVDPGRVAYALGHAGALAVRLAHGKAVGPAMNVVGKTPEKRIVTLRPARLDQLIGVHVPPAEATAILTRLGCKPTVMMPPVASPRPAEFDKAMAPGFEMPTHRPDLTREVDLIEEIARVRGLDKIPAELPAIRPTRDPGGRELEAKRTREVATQLGLSEALTYSFVSTKALEAVGAPAPFVTLKNPLRETATVMRTSILPGLLEAVARAGRHGERNVRLFSVGPVFLAPAADAKRVEADRTLPEERTAFAAVLAGERATYLTKPVPLDVWDAKGLASDLVRRLAGRAGTIEAFGGQKKPPRHLHPRAAGAIALDGEPIGVLGALHPDVLDAFELGESVLIVELDVAKMTALGARGPRFAALPRFPASTRDIALVVKEDILAGDVEAAVRDAAGALAEDVHLFDRFTGGAVPDGHASLAFHVVYRAPDRTLTDAEVDAQHTKVVSAVGQRFGATLRA
jgi:phenylalanyl-tRNA synthetase beta chain